MAKIVLRAHQDEALGKMKNGCILNGGTGSGKSLTSIAYYFQEQGGVIDDKGLIPMTNPRDLYIITAAKKRDDLEWEKELLNFQMSIYPDQNKYKNKISVDSWQNIKKYTKIFGAFFIFDEKKVNGWGAWTKAFLDITRKNRWIMLTATPGDNWMDYLPVFVAHGYFRNKTEFIQKHVVYSPFTNYPKVQRYVNEARLEKYRREILVKMDFDRHTIAHHEIVLCNYNIDEYAFIKRNRWNQYKNKPIENAGEYCLCLRRCVNSSRDRMLRVLDLVKQHRKAIIFYSHDYELDILRYIFTEMTEEFDMAEWNGHKHEHVPTGLSWVYLVEYSAGCEAWNCITTDTIIFFSQNYSYKVMVQAAGRIDRMNTPFRDLYYYHLKSTSDIDKAITMALKRKKKFNETDYAPKFDKPVSES